MAIALIAGLSTAVSVGLATSFAIGTFFTAFAIGAGLSLVSRALMPSPDMGAQMGGRSVMTREAAHSRKIVYGRARIGGNVVFLESTGSDNKYLWLVTVIAAHEIDAYEEVWFNDEKIWDGGSFVGTWGSYVNITFYEGDQTTANAQLVSASTKWTSDHKLLDTAYMVVKLTYDVDKFASGLPNISTVIRGKKVLNPANSTTAWSQNPALCVYDYLRDTKYGLGESASNILTSSVTAAATICDQTVSLAAGGTQARYTIDGVVDTAGSIKSNIDAMLGSMIGRLVFSAGQFEIYAGAYVSPTYLVDESVAVGDISIQTKQSRRSAYNGVKGVFLSEDDNYILADYPAQLSSTFAAQDGDPIYLDMALPFTVNNIRAQRIAKLALFRSRQQEAITIPCNLSALRFKIGDNINVSNVRLGYSNKVFEVVGYNLDFSSGQIVVNVDAIETAASIWNWATSDEEVFLGGGEVELYNGMTAAAPTSLSVTGDSFLNSDGTFNAEFNVTWTNADDAFTDHYVVEWKLASASNYYSMTTKSTPAVITTLQNGQSYNVRVKAINEIGVSSAYVTATPTAATDTTAPNVPSSVSATGQFEAISVNWTNPTASDFSHVDVYQSTSSGGTYALVGKSSGTSFVKVGLSTTTTYYYKVKAVDFTGNQSAFSSVVNATTTTAPAATIPDGSIGNDQLGTGAVSTSKIIAHSNALVNPVSATGNIYRFGGYNDVGTAINAVPAGITLTYNSSEKAISIANDGDCAIQSESFAVDHNSIYKLSLQIKKTSVGGAWYVGANQYTSFNQGSSIDNGNGATSILFGIYNANRAAGTAASNAYFDFKTVNGTAYETVVVYLLGSQVNIDEAPDHLTQGAAYPYIRLDSSANFAGIRILNWGNGATSRTLLVKNMTLAAMTANSIVASSINTTNLAAISSNLGDVTAGSIDINNVFTVTSAGDMTATSAVITGDIVCNNLTVTGATVTGVFPSANIPALSALTGTIGTVNIDNDAVTNALIATDAVNQDSIAANSVTAAEIVAGSVTASEIAANTITANQIAANTITAGQIAANTVTASQIAANTITASQVAANTLTAAQIQASSITVDKLSGDVSELYPTSFYANHTVTTSTTFVQQFHLPAPSLGIVKRQRLDFDFDFTFANSGGANLKFDLEFIMQVKSKSSTGTAVSTVTLSAGAPPQNQWMYMTGNQLAKLDNNGGVANNSSGSGTTGTINSVFFEASLNRTYVMVSSGSAAFSTGDTMYFSPSKFLSAGTYFSPENTQVVQIYIPPSVTVTHRLSFSETFGESSTVTEFRPSMRETSSVANVTAKLQKWSGTMENVS